LLSPRLGLIVQREIAVRSMDTPGVARLGENPRRGGEMERVGVVDRGALRLWGGSRLSANFTEAVVEDAAPVWVAALGYAVRQGPEIAAGEPAAERNDPNYHD